MRVGILSLPSMLAFRLTACALMSCQKKQRLISTVIVGSEQMLPRHAARRLCRKPQSRADWPTMAHSKLIDSYGIPHAPPAASFLRLYPKRPGPRLVLPLLVCD